MTDSNGGTQMYMPVAPAYGGGNGGFGFGGDMGAWWLLILLVAMGGWGNGFGGGFNGGGAFPWVMGGMANTNNDVQRGFDQSALMTGITGVNNAVTSGFGDIQTALCGGFAGVNANIANGFAQTEIAANSRQMANMNQNFALQNQLSTCCCENRLATCQTQNVVQNEGAATRLAIQQQTQAILDKMCEQEIEALKSQNIALQNQVNMQALAASQATQTAQLIADNTAQTQYIVNRVAPYPIPAYTVANPVTPATAA